MASGRGQDKLVRCGTKVRLQIEPNKSKNFKLSRLPKVETDMR